MTKQKWDREKIKQAIESFRQKNNRLPFTKEMDSDENLPSRSIFPKHFNMTYSEWRRHQGDDYSFVDKKFIKMNENELKEWLKQRLIEMGTTELYEYDAMKRQHEPSSYFWKKRFNWDELMKEIGLRDETYYSKEETLKKFKEFYIMNEEKSSSAVKKYDNKLFQSILYHFNKYNDFINELGLEENEYFAEITKTNDELLSDYLTLCDSLGKLASLKDIRECEWMASVETYLYRFGSIQKVRTLLGLDEGKRGKAYYSRDMLLMKGKRIVEEYGTKISVKDFIKKMNCSKNTLYRYFQTTSVREIIDECNKYKGE